MAEITHPQARTLLESAADRSLATADRVALDAHLQKCTACRAYADSLAALEANLRKTLHARWDRYRPALNLQAILQPSPMKLAWSNLFHPTHAFGKVTLIAALFVGYFVIVNLVGIHGPGSNNETPTVLPTPNGLVSNSTTSPTPSIQTTLTDLALPACKTIYYLVEQNDTLESIALRHGITKEEILAYNPYDSNLNANTLFTGMSLRIPACEGAPSRTAKVPGNTLTITPINGTIFPEQPE
jgi:LysM repeat protein